MEIILLCGVAGSGKDYTAENCYADYHTLKIADVLVNWARYELCKDITSKVTYDEFKENIWWFKDGESEKLCTGRDTNTQCSSQRWCYRSWCYR